MAALTFHTVACVGFIVLVEALVGWQLYRAFSKGTVNFDVNFFFDTGFRDPRWASRREYYVDFDRNSHPLIYSVLVIFLTGFSLLLLAIAVVVLKVGIA